VSVGVSSLGHAHAHTTNPIHRATHRRQSTMGTQSLVPHNRPAQPAPPSAPPAASPRPLTTKNPALRSSKGAFPGAPPPETLLSLPCSLQLPAQRACPSEKLSPRAGEEVSRRARRMGVLRVHPLHCVPAAAVGVRPAVLQLHGPLPPLPTGSCRTWSGLLHTYRQAPTLLPLRPRGPALLAPLR